MQVLLKVREVRWVNMNFVSENFSVNAGLTSLSLSYNLHDRCQSERRKAGELIYYMK